MSDTQSTAEATPTAVPAFGGNASTVSALRPDEFFVINHVARTYSGNWRPGENPPDAYLKLHNRSIAVEISTLVQHVPSALNQSRSRYSDDESALRIIQEIKDAIPAFLLNGRTVILTLSPPIKKFRQTRNQLELAVRNELLTNNDVDTNVEIHGNEISIQIKSYGEPADATVVGAVMHRTSSPDILQNARFSLENMIGVKSDKCAALTPPIWLALLNDYWLADPATYRQAMKMLSVTHPFVKILLVSNKEPLPAQQPGMREVIRIRVDRRGQKHQRCRHQPDERMSTVRIAVHFAYLMLVGALEPAYWKRQPKRVLISR